MPPSSSKQVVLYCFSPAVMIGTFIIEMVLAGYVVWRYRLRTPERLIVLLLLCLASFQIAEYNICTGDPVRMVWWTKFGLAGISFLPALGLHLTSLITKKKASVWLAYAGAAVMALIFNMVPEATTGAVCTGNYVVLQTQNEIGLIFGAYYWFFLCVLLLDVYTTLRSTPKLSSASKRVLIWMSIGYCSFMIPMIVAYAISPELTLGAPSIMCGFAVCLAIVLTWKVLPAFQTKKG